MEWQGQGGGGDVMGAMLMVGGIPQARMYLFMYFLFEQSTDSCILTLNGRLRLLEATMSNANGIDYRHLVEWGVADRLFKFERHRDCATLTTPDGQVLELSVPGLALLICPKSGGYR